MDQGNVTKRYVAFWNYLPAFIAVAETGHLRNAAHAMRISPSALSRAICLLEHRIGYALFERTSRGLKLTAAGKRLLDVVRESMLLVDESLAGSVCAPTNYQASVR